MPVDPRIQAMLDSPLKGDCGKGRPRGKTIARGYAYSPGTGPDGQTCGTCAHKVSVQGGSRTFPKCARATHKWTRGGASDIRVKSPACVLWAPRA